MKYYITILISIFFTIPLSVNALSIVPNDPHFNAEYYIAQTNIDKAWGYSIGAEEIIIAVIDSGVDLDHPDIKDNIWINKDETPYNRIDDDKNGYIDDVYGWNFVENNNDPNPQFENYSTEGASHGTLVAGIIAASSNNNEGIAGIAWNSKIMVIRALNSKGEGSMDHASLAIKYAADNGAHIINLSFVGSTFTGQLFDAVKYAYKKGAVIVAAVGNDATADASFNAGSIDAQPVYPACFRESFDDFVIGVGAVDDKDTKTSFSNFGRTCLDINAPGINIISLQAMNASLGSPFNAKYSGYWNGTSFTAPQISGVAALIKSMNFNYNNKDIASIILDTADNIDSVNPSFANQLGRGRLNALRALKAAAPVGMIPYDPVEMIQLKRNNAALWINDNIPTKGETNNFLIINVNFKNKGNVTWQPNYLVLKIFDANGKQSVFNPKEINYRGSQDVLPSQTVNFSYALSTPSDLGDYHLKLQLFYRGYPIKGGTVYRDVSLTSPKNAAIAKISAPIAVLKAWNQIPVNVVVQNNSKEIWNKNKVIMRLEGKTLAAVGNISPTEEITAPGKTASFSFFMNFKASPKGVQSYTMRLMVNGTLLDIEGGKRILRID